MHLPTTRPLMMSLLAAACMAPALAQAITIDSFVNINVYQVCLTDGSACASQGPVGNEYYAAETNKIWAQAGISVNFTFIETIFNTNFYNLDDNTPGQTFDDLYNFKFGAGTAATVTDRVDMFLINDYQGAYGVGYSGFGGLVMSMKSISEFDCGGDPLCTGRIDTLAHELGHNFGLVPTTFVDYAGAADPGHSNITHSLMAGGGVRMVPTTLADIAPDGLGYDLLPQTHIDFARQSTLISAVPEPGTWAMFAFGLVGLGAMVRRRQA